MAAKTKSRVVAYQPPTSITVVDAPKPRPTASIVDIRSDKESRSLRSELVSMLETSNTETMKLPFLLLYDEKGLQLFEAITRLPSYYPAKSEMQILRDSYNDLANEVEDNTTIVELGSGSLYKTATVLKALSESGKRNLSYYALDVDHAELARTLAELPEYDNITCHGLWGTFEDGFQWIKDSQHSPGSFQILFLGSSIGNFSRPEALGFLKQVAQALRAHTNDGFLVTFDHCEDHSKLWNAYHDVGGGHEAFLMNALVHANRLYGGTLFDLEAWRADGEIDASRSSHQLFFRALRDTNVGGRVLRRGERIDLGQNIKYPKQEVKRLFHEADLCEGKSWEGPDGDYALYKAVRLPVGRGPARQEGPNGTA